MKNAITLALPFPLNPWLRPLPLRRTDTQTIQPPSDQRPKEKNPFGIAIPGTPWYFLQPGIRKQGRSVPPGPTPRPPTPVGRTSPNKPFLPRVPDIESVQGKDRLRRFTETLSSAFNSLVGQDILVLEDPANQTWSIPAATPAAPTSIDGGTW